MAPRPSRLWKTAIQQGMASRDCGSLPRAWWRSGCHSTWRGASALVDLCLGRRSYFAVRTQSRRSVQVYDVVQTVHGVVAQEVDLPDLLTHYILNEMAGTERRGRDWIDLMTKDLRNGPSLPC